MLALLFALSMFSHLHASIKSHMKKHHIWIHRHRTEINEIVLPLPPSRHRTLFSIVRHTSESLKHYMQKKKKQIHSSGWRLASGWRKKERKIHLGT
jgi:hypothetical protein